MKEIVEVCKPELHLVKPDLANARLYEEVKNILESEVGTRFTDVVRKEIDAMAHLKADAFVLRLKNEAWPSSLRNHVEGRAARPTAAIQTGFSKLVSPPSNSTATSAD